ncbi:MAG: hypothetical protein CSA44_01950 [Gammaproteobacteria bacterium]|nr:MAG: hypothetical protein CSA44_01950 [Gammaproteobacteria bacterium]
MQLSKRDFSNKLRKFLYPALLSLGFVVPVISHGAPECPVDELAVFTWGQSVNDATHIDANEVQLTREKAIFTGDVIAKRGQEIFHSPLLNYHRQTEVVSTPKGMIYGRPDFAIQAEKASYSLAKQSGDFQASQYYMAQRQANGRAENIEVDRSTDTENLTNATYSTCPGKKKSWSVKAKEIHLDHSTGMGSAWHTTFRIKDVPVFYLPYFSFPIDDRRRTGFLIPSGNLSESRGLDLTIPYYINIAPNQDATLYPRLMSKRGFMLGAEYRYLLPSLSGTVAGSYMDNDRKSTLTKRWAFKTEHHYQPNNHFSIYGKYQRVSDKNYLNDFNDSLDLSNKTFLDSELTATYTLSPNYQMKGQLKDYQLADSNYSDTDKPYALLPIITGSGSWLFNDNFELSSHTELADFYKENAVSGWRLNQKFSLAYLYETSFAFIKPKFTYNYTSYHLKRQTVGLPNHISRSIPTFSIDSGLYFDRQTNWFGHNATQSLEPRLYYLQTPYKRQSDIPNFDSTLLDASSRLFSDNRFSGKDRIGDANQLTAAITTRYTDNNSGRELAKVSVGQIQYFKDRRVSLNNSVSKKSRSNVFIDGNFSITDKVNVRGLAHYNIDATHTEKSLLGITYHHDEDKAINLTHLYDDNNYKQIDFSGVWRLNDNWRSFWRWNYSVQYSKTIDVLGGIEYAECCWGIRLLARQKRDRIADREPENSIMFEFALKGLGNIGSNTTSILSDIIPDYRPINYETR